MASCVECYWSSGFDEEGNELPDAVYICHVDPPVVVTSDDFAKFPRVRPETYACSRFLPCEL